MTTVPGYVSAEGIDAPSAGHYGDPLREQRNLVRGAGLIDRSSRGLVVISGADRLSWLHSLSSQHVSELADLSSIEGLILSPHGHIEHDLWFTEFAGETWIDCEPGTAAALSTYLESMRFMLRVEVADRSADFAQLTVAGPDASRVVGALLEAVPAAGSITAHNGGFVRTMPWPDEFDVVVPLDSSAAVIDALMTAGAVPVGLMAYEALRVEAMRPRLGYETDHRTIPHEIGLLQSAVHLNKGCYRGQETVARVHNLGRPPRRLVRLHLDGSLHTLPEPGSAVALAGRVVGFLGTAALHHDDGPIALAVIKRNIADGAELIVRGEEDEYAAKVDIGIAV